MVRRNYYGCLGSLAVNMDLDWLDEKIPRLERGNWLYDLVCFLLGKRKTKLSYKEYMMILYGINRKTLGEHNAREKSIIRAIDVYKGLHNGDMPPTGIEEENE